MSETMSSPSSDWSQFYLHNNSGQARTHPAALFTSNQAVSDANTTSSNSLSPEGRVAKPIRRRSRASRRTPTTLLNTDTANFRAMVQQFTGGPLAAAYATGSSTSGSGGPYNFGGSNFSFGPAQVVGDHHPNAVMVPRAAGYGNNILHLQQPHFQQQQQQQQQNMVSLNNNNRGGDDQGFLLQGVFSSPYDQERLI